MTVLQFLARGASIPWSVSALHAKVFGLNQRNLRLLSGVPAK